MMWLTVIESWMVTEEEFGYCCDLSSRRDEIKEFEIYHKFKELYLVKMEKLKKLEEKKKEALEFKQEFKDVMSDAKLLSQIQAKVFGNRFTPTN